MTTAPRGLLALPLIAIVVLCSGLPVAWLAWQIVTNPSVLVEALPTSWRLHLLLRTLLYNGSVAILATILALPAAIVLGRGRGWVARLLWLALPVALLLPSLTYAYGWTQVVRLSHDFAMRQEWETLDRWLAFELAGPLDVFRCIWSLATWLWPIPAAAVGLALRRTNVEVQQQALLDGALWRVTLRMLAGPLAASSAAVGVLALQEFSVYEPTGISVVATEVRMVFETGALSLSENPIHVAVTGQRARAAAAVAVSLPLLVVIALLAIVVVMMVRRISAAEQIDVPHWGKALQAGWTAKALAVAVIVITIVVPLIALILSLSRPMNLGRTWLEFRPQLTGSLFIAGLAGMLALGIALWGAIARSRIALVLALISFLVGGQLLAIAMIRLYNRPGLGWVYNAPPIVVAAYMGRFAWVALLIAGATWTRAWKPLRDIAAVDGAGAIRTASSVVWPIAWPGLLAGAVLIAALSLGEVPATVLISPHRPQMLIPLMMTWVHMLRYDAMIETSLLLMTTVALLGIAIALLVALGRSRWKTGATALLPLVMLIVAGCYDDSQPRAIWCETGTGPAQVIYPRGIAYSPDDDTFFLVDRQGRVQQLDRTGKFVTDWRIPQWRAGQPVGVSVGPDGLIYIPDTHYHRVLVYNRNGELLRQWGTFGRDSGQFIFPTDVVFDSKGNVFVSEYGDNDRIQVFRPDGTYLYEFGRFGQGPGELARPQSMVMIDDLLYVTDSCNHRIAVFASDGTFVRNMGSVGSELGQFRFPYGLDVDGQGRLVVCEFGNNRVQLVDPQSGQGLATWGAGGRRPGQLAYPWAVAVDRSGRVVAVDSGNNRLQVFEF